MLKKHQINTLRSASLTFLLIDDNSLNAKKESNPNEIKVITGCTMVAKTKIVAINHQDLVLIFNSEKSLCGFTLPKIQKRIVAKTRRPKISPTTKAISHWLINTLIISSAPELIHFLFESLNLTTAKYSSLRKCN